MIERKLKDSLLNLAKQFRIVTLIGPRQAGKSTLCQMAFPDKPIVNLEEPETRLLAEKDPKGLLLQYPDGAFIDEIQRCPELLSYIQVIVDESQIPGQFIISGSHQLSLMEAVSQSLAGRTAILKLLPLSFEEIKNQNPLSIDNLLYRGSYPEIISKNFNPTEAYSFYVQTYLEKDVRQIQAVRDLSIFQNFLKLLAGRSGSILNMTSLSNDLGVSENTIRSWISILEATFVVFRLQPFYKNLGKKISKSPKIYFYDTGLLCYLLGIKEVGQINSHPLKGSIFETYIISESLKYLWNRVRESNLYFYRDKVLEIDLIAETSEGPKPIEIKSSATFKEDLLKRLVQAQKRLEGLNANSSLIYTGDKSFKFKDTQIISIKNLELLGETILT